MGKKFAVITLAFVATAFASASRSNAGTDMIIDNSAQAPPPTTYYAPAPRIVYYAPPPPRVVVYAAPVVRVYGYHRPLVRRTCWHPHWR